MPACFARRGSVRNRPNIQSASLRVLVQILWPLITHWSPSSSARLASEARSLPAPGSL